jgi:hypothetical protein
LSPTHCSLSSQLNPHAPQLSSSWAMSRHCEELAPMPQQTSTREVEVLQGWWMQWESLQSIAPSQSLSTPS